MHFFIYTRFILIVTLTVFTAQACAQKDEQTASAPVATNLAPQLQTSAALSIPDKGKKIYARCRACHTLKEGGRHRVGPNLWGIFGQRSGTMEGYAYSKAIIKADIIWDAQTIDAYITNPKQFIPGNKMSFIGLRKAEDRENLIAYLQANTTPQ